MKSHDVNHLFNNNNALLNLLLRRSRNHLLRVGTVRSETRSCGITLRFHLHINDLFHSAVSTSISSIIFSAPPSVRFSPTFFLHVALNLCTRLQLCSTAQSSRSDSSLPGSSSRSVPAVHGQFSEPADGSSPPAGGHLLRYHVCLGTCVLECLSDASLPLDFTFVSLVSGHPRPPVVKAPSVPWVSLPGPTGVPPMPKQDGIGSRAPTLWLRCVSGGGHGRCSYTCSTSKF